MDNNKNIMAEDKISVSECNLFIENNALRYMEIFSDNSDRSVFTHTNWAAFSFTGIWLSYRKMYKTAVLMIVFLLLLLVGSFGVSFTVADNLKAQVEMEADDYEKFEFLQNEEVAKYLTPEDISDLYTLYNSKTIKKNKIGFWAITIPLILFVVAKFIFSLFADCLYRKFIHKNYKSKSGGTSVIGATVTGLIYLAIAVITVVVLGIISYM